MVSNRWKWMIFAFLPNYVDFHGVDFNFAAYTRTCTRTQYGTNESGKFWICWAACIFWYVSVLTIPIDGEYKKKEHFFFASNIFRLALRMLFFISICIKKSMSLNWVYFASYFLLFFILTRRHTEGVRNRHIPQPHHASCLAIERKKNQQHPRRLKHKEKGKNHRNVWRKLCCVQQRKGENAEAENECSRVFNTTGISQMLFRPKTSVIVEYC